MLNITINMGLVFERFIPPAQMVYDHFAVLAPHFVRRCGTRIGNKSFKDIHSIAEGAGLETEKQFCQITSIEMQYPRRLF